MLEDVLDPEADLAPIIQDYDALLDSLAARWPREGLIPSPYVGSPFEQRFARVALDAGNAAFNWIQYFDFSYPEGGLTADTPIHQSAAVFNLWSVPGCSTWPRKLIGPKIVVNPNPPCAAQAAGGGSARGAARRSDGSDAVAPGSGRRRCPRPTIPTSWTVWLPITDATVENGCLCVIPGSHRSDLVTHCPGYGGLHIPDSLLQCARARADGRGQRALLHRLTQTPSLDEN